MSTYPKGNNHENKQEHSGDGDNIWGNKYVNLIIKLQPRYIVIISLIVMGVVTLLLWRNWYTDDKVAKNDIPPIVSQETTKIPQKILSDTCQEQEEKLRVDIAHFSPAKSQPFAFRLVNDIKDHISSNKYSAQVELFQKYLTSNKQREKITAKKCNYRGFVVYGNRSVDEGNQSLSCVIDIVNTKKIEATHRLEEPSSLAFKIDEHSEYISYFISGLLKYYLNFNKEANADFKKFLSKVKFEKKLNKRKKLIAYANYYLGRIEFEKHNIEKAVKLLVISDSLHTTKFCRKFLNGIRPDFQNINKIALNNDLKINLEQEVKNSFSNTQIIDSLNPEKVKKNNKKESMKKKSSKKTYQSLEEKLQNPEVV